MYKSKKFMCMLMGLVAMLVCSISAYGYETYSFRLSRGIRNQNYLLYSSLTEFNGYYSTAFSRWNATSSQTGFSFSPTTNVAASAIDCYARSFGHTSTNGVTDWFQFNSSNNPEYATIDLNTYAFPYISSAQKPAIPCHEIGHAIGLRENNSSTSYIMCQYSSGRTATSPAAEEIQVVANKYR